MSAGNPVIDPLADAIAARVVARLLEAQSDIRLLDVKAAAKYIGRSAEALRRLIRKGAVPTVRRDGRVMLDRRDLDQWIELGKGRG